MHTWTHAYQFVKSRMCLVTDSFIGTRVIEMKRDRQVKNLVILIEAEINSIFPNNCQQAEWWNDTRFEKYGQPEVGDFEWRVLLLVQEEEIFRLQISVHHPHRVTVVNDGGDLSEQRHRSPLGVVSLGNYAIKELPTLAELHNKVHRVPVFVGSLKLHDVPVPCQVVHDLHLPPDIFDVVFGDQLPRRDRFAGEDLLGLLVGDEVGDTELPAAELAPKVEDRSHVFHRVAEDTPDFWK